MRKSKRRETLSFDLTPLIDVVFLLLIFFLVTSTFKKDELALLLKLPKNQDGKANSKQQAEKFLIELNHNSIAINGETIPVGDFENRVKNIKNKNVPFILRADQKVEYAKVIDILGVLQKYEIPNLSLVTESEVK